LIGVLAQEPRPNAVERTSPGQDIGHNTGLIAQCLPRNPFNSLCHLGCRSPRKRHEQDPSRIGAVDNEMGYSMCQGVGLAGTGTGNDQKWITRGAIPFRNSMLDRAALLRVEGIEMGCHGHDRIILRMEFDDLGFLGSSQ
jgi:hypothetical protein